MAKYINKDKFIKSIRKRTTKLDVLKDGPLIALYMYIASDLENIEDEQYFEDLRPVTHAHWITKPLVDDKEVAWDCSYCGLTCHIYKGNYCPHCGAQMDEDE